MILHPTPDVRRDKLVIGTCIRKPLDVVQAYLRSLASQELPPRVDRSYHFVMDGADEDVCQYVAVWAKEHGGLCEIADGPRAQDFDDNHPVTHQWNSSAMARVALHKNRILQAARAGHADAVWFCDADLLCDSRTLRSLWYADVPIACAVYWTKWHNAPEIHAAPQVWLRHPYELTGRGYPDEGAFRARLQTRQLTEVWGQGACTLLRKPALALGINFSYVPGVPLEGMMAGEDRHFCIQATAAHLPMHADPWPHIFHIYHPDDRKLIAVQEQALSALRTEPKWINVRLQVLEPIPVSPTQSAHPRQVVVRCRLGAGHLLRDLEEQLLEHLDGKPFMASVHFPLSYPIPILRGTRKLMEAMVIDFKNDSPMPVLGDDLKGGWDRTLFSDKQLAELQA